jgi:exonuclease SbcD
MRLSQAKIPTLLLVGNHDLSPAIGRAHAVQEFDTLQVPFVRVLHRPELLGPAQLWDVPVQVMALPWISRSALMASLASLDGPSADVPSEWGSRVSDVVNSLLEEADPSLPLVLTAHASIEGAAYGAERAVMLGSDLVLPASLVKSPRFDYVALGHIHRAQDLNAGAHPPVVYPGSIERVDFGEAQDEKFFIMAEVGRGASKIDWRQLEGIRPFVDRRVTIDSDADVTGKIRAAMPAPQALSGAIVRITVEYPRELEPLIDEPVLREHAGTAFEFHLVKRPHVERRARLAPDQAIGSLGPMELLELYWRASNASVNDELRELARQLLAEDMPPFSHES